MQKYKHISIYFFSYFLNAAISFGVVSLLTHHLSTKDYGIINLYSGAIAFLTPLLSGGILQTVNVEFFKRDKPGFARFFSDALAIPLAGLLLFTFLAFVFTVPLMHFLKVSNFFIWLIPATAFFILFTEMIASITRNRNQPGLFAAFSIGKNTLEACLSVIFVLVLHETWNGRINALILAPALVSIPVYILLKKWGYLIPFSGIASVKTILVVSSPLIIERMSVFVISSSDRYFIDHYVSTAEVGLYSVGAQIAIIANLTLLSMNNFFYPYIFRELKKKHEKKGGNLKKAILAYIGVSVITVAGVLIATPLVFNWFIGDAFQEGRFYALLLTSAYLPWTIYQSLIPVLLYHQENKYIMFISLIAIASSLLFNIMLVPMIGARGAAFTMLFVNAVMALLAYARIRQKHSPL